MKQMIIKSTYFKTQNWAFKSGIPSTLLQLRSLVPAHTCTISIHPISLFIIFFANVDFCLTHIVKVSSGVKVVHAFKGYLQISIHSCAHNGTQIHLLPHAENALFYSYNRLQDLLLGYATEGFFDHIAFFLAS